MVDHTARNLANIALIIAIAGLVLDICGKPLARLISRTLWPDKTK